MTGERPVSAVDWAALRLQDRYPRNPMEVGAILRFGGPSPRVGEFRRHLAASVPELWTVLVRPPGRRRPGWAAREPDWEGLVRHRALPETSGETGLRLAAEEIQAAPLPREGHLWRTWLLDGYAEDEWALVIQCSHAQFDAAGLWGLAARCFPSADARPARPARPPRKSVDLWTVLKGLARYARGFFPLSGRTFSSHGLTGERRLVFETVELARLTRIGHRHGATVNEVFLAALAGALRAWPHTPWRTGRPGAVWTLLGIDIRALDGTPGPGNRLAVTRYRLPCDEADATVRLRLLVRTGSATKSSGAANVGRAGIRLLPDWLLGLLARWSLSRWYTEMIVANVPGPAIPPVFGGRNLRSTVPLGLLQHGRPLGVFLSSVAGQATLNVTTDSSLPSGAGLVRLWLAALDELDG
ncbi:wax ester/triacylglycerol synthase domain-containing protein [Amycolatopsis sp. H20-H5]|uniref:wax ester/triacylglycerol synthase domain-containing protein n=1 Tax=Amycolatopsis sp. H20-H5 TaxID=3046309 RepID=UPI002DBB4E28|nr:wax ester/triacylglycerol synthase domain-containing protein [Amycolatopsis sp. H20-H5]MEC3974508.1 wax ester/triacylglycerol synthase domain-containing protein [Amycolatopsis sp. H20-H5]